MGILNVLKANKGILTKSLIGLGAAAGLAVVYVVAKKSGSDDDEVIHEVAEETEDTEDEEVSEKC